MRKAELLRAALVEAFPEFKTDPERLILFSDKGSIASRLRPPNHSFEYRYTLTILMLDFTRHVSIAMLTVLRWLAVHQPDLLRNHATGNEAIAFEADVQSEKVMDLQLKVALTESVQFVTRNDGGYDLVHLDESLFTDAIAEALGDLPAYTLLDRVWLDGAQILPPA